MRQHKEAINKECRLFGHSYCRHTNISMGKCLSRFMKIVIAELGHDKQKNHEAAGNADREPEDINYRKHLLFLKFLYGEKENNFLA